LDTLQEGERARERDREREDDLPPATTQPRRPASPETIQQAIDEVNHIIETLRDSLDEMDEVLELLEIAERQKNADEQEIESLRRAMTSLQRPRGGERGGAGGSHPREHHPQSSH